MTTITHTSVSIRTVSRSLFSRQRIVCVVVLRIRHCRIQNTLRCRPLLRNDAITHWETTCLIGIRIGIKAVKTHNSGARAWLL